MKTTIRIFHWELLEVPKIGLRACKPGFGNCVVALSSPIETEPRFNQKHCQRHNGAEGWVLLTKETSSYTNLDQIPKFKIFRPNFNIKILTKHSLHNLTKPQQQNTDQTSVSKVSLELQLQTLGQTLCSKSEQNLALWPNFSFQNCIKLSSKRFSSSTSATVTNSTSFELASSQATRHINQVY